ncbi:response regulator transcription factor [Microaceticoccus formicicus]|uniref:response regulator transcription factor n=1 Tax=Microaceticoccus formicicus TaxID=3118105 RepID=UPI003CD01B3A|nr:response regulator transcription factor [Peptoniphilaceae bacterium AMB_02]
MNRKILLIEDEKGISSIISSYLQKEGYEVSQAYDGGEALKYFTTHDFDLVILDRMLPLISGEEVLKTIRQLSDIPVILVTAKVEEIDKIEGFQLGADDYVTKPFSPKELMERVRAILRRIRKDPVNTNILSFDNGRLIINLDNYTCKVNGNEVTLTNNEFSILQVLFSKPGKIFTREEIISIAFGDEYDAFDRAIDTHIKNIRQKIEESPRDPKYIKTVYGVGYKTGESL